jgi:hypothetical protein
MINITIDGGNPITINISQNDIIASVAAQIAITAKQEAETIYAETKALLDSISYTVDGGDSTPASGNVTIS